MGLFDFLTGTRNPKSGVAAVSADELHAAIMGVNRETAPFQIARDDSGKADYVAEWKIVDATWYEVFAKAGLKKAFRIYMKLDPEKSELRALDESYTITWRAGIPTTTLSATSLRGQKQELSFGSAYAFTEELRPGEVYNYHFNTREIKQPLQDVVAEHGWTWRGVTFGKL